jgi:hypothetical protein
MKIYRGEESVGFRRTGNRYYERVIGNTLTETVKSIKPT